MHIHIIFVLFTNTVFSMLTKIQWSNIQTILQHPQVTSEIKNKVDNIIFHHYLPFAYSECYQFIKFHKHKTKYIPKDDLKHHSCIGLYHATRKYNGKYNFGKFAKIYIRGSLYNCLTKQYVIDKRTKKERRLKNTINYHYQYDVDTPKNMYLGKRCDIAHSTFSDNFEKELYLDIWYKIFTLQKERDKHILFDKFDFSFNRKKTNLELSKKYNCSEETIRQIVHKNIMNLTSCNIYAK